MEQRGLGRSGIEVSRLILGCGNFGGIGSAPAFFGRGETEDRPRDHGRGLGARPPTLRHRGRLRRRPQRDLDRRLDARAGRRPRVTSKTFNAMEDGADFGLAPRAGAAPGRGEPGAARRRPHRSLPDARAGSGHAGRGDARGLRRASAQGTIGAWGVSNVDAACSRRLELGPAARAELVLAARPRRRGRGDPALRARRDRLPGVQPARRRLADREVPARRGAAGRLPDDHAAGAVPPPERRRRSTRSRRSRRRAASAVSSPPRWRSPGLLGRGDRGRASGRAGRSTSSRARGAALALSPGRARGSRLGLRMLLLNARGGRAAPRHAGCMEAMEEALVALARGEFHLPLRLVLKPPARADLLGLMPTFRGGERAVYALKTIVVVPDNAARGLDPHQGTVTLYDGAHRRARRVMNATPITAIRTAAVSGVATRRWRARTRACWRSSAPGTRRTRTSAAMLEARPFDETAPEPTARAARGAAAAVGSRRGGACAAPTSSARDELARARPALRVAQARRARERGRCLLPARARARHRDGRRRRSSSTGASRAERGGRLPRSPPRKARSGPSTSWRSSARCWPARIPGRTSRRRDHGLQVARPRGRGSRRRRARGRRARERGRRHEVEF